MGCSKLVICHAHVIDDDKLQIWRKTAFNFYVLVTMISKVVTHIYEDVRGEA
ncbi:hypothetical protein YC2023_102293 [Brassica napus]